MKKILFIVCALFFFAGCSRVITPAIEGTVIDKVTKQPVENAWVLAMAEVVSYNPGGANGNYYRLTRFHSSTGKDGKFSIPSISTGGFGAEQKRLRIDIYAPEGKRGAIDIDMVKGRIPYPVAQDGETIIEPSASLREKNLTVIIPVKNVEMTIEQKRKDVSELAIYCGDGSYLSGGPKASNACDEKEYIYLINECEMILDQLVNPKSPKQIAMYTGQLSLLASIHREAGNYKKALDYYQQLYNFCEKHTMTLNLREYKTYINELKQKIKE
jgi:hypothetical protein